MQVQYHVEWKVELDSISANIPILNECNWWDTRVSQVVIESSLVLALRVCSVRQFEGDHFGNIGRDTLWVPHVQATSTTLQQTADERSTGAGHFGSWEQAVEAHLLRTWLLRCLSFGDVMFWGPESFGIIF